MNAKVLNKKHRSEQTTPLAHALELQQQGHLVEAEVAFLDILKLNPNEPISLYSLGIIALGHGEKEKALQLFRKGCETSPSFAYNWFGYANTLQSLGRREEALLAYDEAIKAKPDYLEALVNSGVLLRDLHRHHEALLRFNQVLEFDPNYPNALGNCAILLTEFKESAKAIAMLERLLERNPDYDYGLGLLMYERLHIGDWTGFDHLREQIIDGVREGKRACKSLAFMAISDKAADHFQCAQIFAKQYCPPAKEALWRGEQYSHKKLRIAYISPDLREHPVGHLMCGIFEHHDKNRIETIAISLGIDDQSRLRQRMLDAFDHFIDARGMTSQKIAEIMREMEVDIAIDLAGYTADSRIDVFSYRPAPVHINFLGYPGTLAVDYMDYILADRHIIPREHQAFYREKVLYLPDTYLPTDSNLIIAEETPSRESCGLPPQGAVFCSFSHDYKISPPLWAVWMSLLQKTAGSVLWLVARNTLTQENFRRAAETHGVAPERIIFAARVPRVEDHLARYRLADIFLDTWPYNAHTTAADALSAGLPVVTYMGGAFPARVAGSLLHAIGLPELATHSWADYEAQSLKLVSDPTLLANIKQRLKQNKATHALFDTARFCRNLEDILFSVAQTPVPNLNSKPLSEQLPAVATTLEQILSNTKLLIAQGNFPQAELYLRLYQNSGGRNLTADTLMPQIENTYGLPTGFQLDENVPRSNQEKYLFIRAWGHNFWSDVHHVLGQLLLAELTQRTPIVYWGSNSHFRDTSNSNAFELFFEPITSLNFVEHVNSLPVFPPKWNSENLYGPEVNTWRGENSRIAAPYLFTRPEAIVVSDFYAPLASITPWIAPNSAYYGMSNDAIYRQLYKKYLRPKPTISEQVETFYLQKMAGRPWVAIDVRDADSFSPRTTVNKQNGGYFDFIDRMVEINPGIGLLVFAETFDLLEAYKKRYGQLVLEAPIFLENEKRQQHVCSGYSLGKKILSDTLLAIRCDYFIGSKTSSNSQSVSSLKHWMPGCLFLFDEDKENSENWLLHNQEFVPPAEQCILCGTSLSDFPDFNLFVETPISYSQCHKCAGIQAKKIYCMPETSRTSPKYFARGEASSLAKSFFILPNLFKILDIKKSDYALDISQGGNFFANLMCDIGYNFDVHDICINKSELYFESPEYRLITLFSTIDHFPNPQHDWDNVFSFNPEIVIGSTNLFEIKKIDSENFIPESDLRNFYYSPDTFSYLAKKYGRSAYCAGKYFIFVRQALDVSVLEDIERWHTTAYSTGKTFFDKWFFPTVPLQTPST